MSDDAHSQHDDHPDESGHTHAEPAHALEVFGRGVRTALRNNATAYGFSISLTAAYGLISGARGNVTPTETICFAFGGALAFVVVGLVFMTRSPRGRLPESGQVVTFSGGIDLLGVAVAVSAAYCVSLVPGFAAWPLTAFATVTAYLLVSGLDVLLARAISRHTSFGSSQ